MKSRKTTCQFSVSLSNGQEFRELVAQFSKKAHELNEIAHKLELFQFQGELESSILSEDAD